MDHDDIVDRGAREHYEDAELYDFEYRRRRADVAFYRGLANRLLGGPGRILELAAGTGRATTALLRDGHEVVAMEPCDAMRERAERRIARLGAAARARATVVPGDMRGFELGSRFDLVIAVFNALEHLYIRPEFTACLEAVRAHLSPKGRFAFDVQMPNLEWLTRDPDRRWAKTKFTHPRTGEKLVYSTNHEYDEISQIAIIRLYYAPASATGRGQERVVTLTQRKYFPAELDALIALGGFRIEERYGDFAGKPLTPSALSQVIVCRPRPGR